MTINPQSFGDGSAQAPVSPPDPGASFFGGTGPAALSPSDPGASFFGGTDLATLSSSNPGPLFFDSVTTKPISPPDPGPSLFDNNQPSAVSMLDMGMVDDPPGAADFVNNSGNFGSFSSPLPDSGGSSWLTDAINSNASTDSLIDQNPESRNWGLGGSLHSTIAAQWLQNFLHLGNSG